MSADDPDLRLVRSFTVVAEHRHFGRAATAPHLTPSSLSRQIGRLERQVGARLLDRTPQGTRLTEAHRGRLVTAFRRCAETFLTGPDGHQEPTAVGRHSTGSTAPDGTAS